MSKSPYSFLLATVSLFALSPLAASAQTLENPWDYGGEGQAAAAAEAGVAQGNLRVIAAKSWTEMSYPELLSELEREDGTYSPYTKKQMRNRLHALEYTQVPEEEEAKAEPSATLPAVELPAGAVILPAASVQGEAGAVAAPVVVVPAVPQNTAPTTPWWKLPKSQQAAAKAAQEKQQQEQIQSTIGDAATPAEEKKETARDRIYRQIQKNRGY